jgi:CelD/BcsL family acetyltransferase involved in cellulose biosynthesis
VRVARFVGHGAADELGPVCAPDDRPAALAALRAISTDGLLHSDLVLAERLPDEPGVQEGFGGRVLQREPNPAIASAGLSWEDYLARRSRNFREQVRRRERALRRGHEVAFRLSADPARLDADLTILFALHDRRWAGTGSGALAGSAARFHRAFASEALARGWLRLWVMEVDGEPAAAWYGLRYGGREWYYQSGRDPAWDGASVGFVLLAHTIREAMRDGVSEYRLLRGGEAYKARFATVDHPLVTCVAPATAIGQAAAAVLGAIDLRRPRLRAALKRAVR